MNGVSQSNVIAGFLLVGFLVFITARGQLPAYLKVLGLEPSQPSQTDLTNLAASLY